MATKPAVQKVEIALTALELQEVQAWANDICTKCRSAFDVRLTSTATTTSTWR